MVYYKMIVKNIKTGEKSVYISKRQGEHPAGHIVCGIAGAYSKPRPDYTAREDVQAILDGRA